MAIQCWQSIGVVKANKLGVGCRKLKMNDLKRFWGEISGKTGKICGKL